jgi:general secretion pathway protein M
MMPQWQQYLQARTPRERRMLLIGAIAGVLLLIIAIVMPLQRSVSASAQRLERKREDLIWLRSMAPQLAGLQLQSPRPAAHESIVVLIDRTAREAGLAKSLVGSQPSGDGALNVRLTELPFDALISWLAQLRELYGVRVDAATIDSANGAGTVNASLVLRPG